MFELYSFRAQHRRHRSPLERTGNPHLQATRSVGRSRSGACYAIGVQGKPAWQDDDCTRQRITRPYGCGGIATRNSASHERREGWITIAVPPTSRGDLCARAGTLGPTRLTRRGDVTPSVVQGSSRAANAATRCTGHPPIKRRKIHYYVLGSAPIDLAFICDIACAQDLLDEVV